jgi:Tol biopolymer transport system component
MDARIIVAALCLGTVGLGVSACGGQTTSPVSPSSLGAASGPNTTPGTTPGTTSTVTPVPGRLVFSSDRDGASYIYTSIGTEVRRLAPGDRPKWSPDGTRILYQAASPGYGVYVMNADGSGPRYLASGVMPDWSPDGSQIVFMFGNLSDGGLYMMGADGSGVRRVVERYVDGSYEPQTPAWSPDRRTIAFIGANYNDPWQIYVVGIDGTPPRVLADTSRGITTQSEPEWSPDGSQIVFGTFNGIATVNADGSGWRTVVSGRVIYPDWLASGFVFVRYTGEGPTSLGGWEHRIFASEGGMERQVVPDVANGRKYLDSHPDWTR